MIRRGRILHERTLIAGVSFLMALAGTTAARAQVTPGFYTPDDNLEGILYFTATGTVSTELTEVDITGVTGESDVDFEDNGIVFGGGSIFFTEYESDSILKYDGTTLSLLTSESALETVQSVSDSDPFGLAFSGGSLFVMDAETNNVLKIDPGTGTPTVHTTKADFEALTGIGSFDNETTIVGAGGGSIFVGSDASPNAIFDVAPDGTPSVFSTSPLFGDIDQWMTIAPNGDVIVYDDLGSGLEILRVASDGTASVFLSIADLETVGGAGNIDIEGMAFDTDGNFYILNEGEDDPDGILKWLVDDLSLGTIDVSSGFLLFDEGILPGDPHDFESGLAFTAEFQSPQPPTGGQAAAPEPSALALAGLGLLSLGMTRRRRR